MDQTGLSREVNSENLEMDNLTKTSSSEHIFATPQNSQDQLAELQEMLVSATANLKIEEIRDQESFKSTSNFPTVLNNELETQDLVGFKWTLGKEESQVPKTLEDEFEGLKISEIGLKNHIATNTNITQDTFLTEEETIPSPESRKDPPYSCLNNEDSMKVVKKEVLIDGPLIKEDKLNSDESFIEKNRRPRSKRVSIQKQKSQHSATHIDNPLKKTVLEKLSTHCSSCAKHAQRTEEKARDFSAETDETVKEKFYENLYRPFKSKVALKCRSWNASNERAVSEFSSKVKASPLNSTRQRSESLSLEHTRESTRETSSIIPEPHRNSLTIPKMGKFQEESKCCRSKYPSRLSKTDNSIDPMASDVRCEQSEDFFDCQSTCSFQQQTSTEKNSTLEASPGDKVDCQRPSQSSSSTSRSRSRFEDQSSSLDTCKVSKLSDGSASRSVEWSSSSSSEFKHLEKKDTSPKSFASFPAPEDKLPRWNMLQFCKIPRPDSSLEFLQDKISNLLNEDQHMDIVIEMAKLAERNLKLQDELSEKDTKIDKLAQQSESVTERCEEIEVDLVSNLVITDDKISKLSRIMKIARRFQVENNALWQQIKKLKDMISEKDRKISRLLHLKNNDSRKDEIRYLKEKLNHLESENAVLSANFKKSDQICKQYEKDLEGLEKNLRHAEDKLRMTFIDLKGIVRNQTAKRKPLDSGNPIGKEIENDISKSVKEAEKKNAKKDPKAAVSEFKVGHPSSTRIFDSLDKPSERIDKGEAYSGQNRNRHKRSFKKLSQELNSSPEVKRSQGD